MTLAPEVRKQIAELRKAGYIYNAIARMLDVSCTAAKNVCDEEKVPEPKKKLGRKRKYSEEQIKAVIDLRKEGYVCRAIAEMVDMPEGYVSSVCKRAGLRGPGTLGRRMSGYNSEEERLMYTTRKKEIRELREQGLLLRVIGEKYGITRERVRQLCVGVERPDIRVRKNCGTCGVEFIPNELFKTGYTSSKYCSRECGKKGMTANMITPESKWSRAGTVRLTCAGCGADFDRTRYIESIGNHVREVKGLNDSGLRFCSRECYWENASMTRQKKEEDE